MISCMKKMCVDIFKPKKDFSKRFTRSKVGNFFYMFFLLLAGLFTMLPLIYSILTSFKPIDELLIFPPRFFVKRPTISNYLVLPDLLSGLQIPFSRYIFNSIFVSIVTTFLYIISSSMVRRCAMLGQPFPQWHSSRCGTGQTRKRSAW